MSTNHEAGFDKGVEDDELAKISIEFAAAVRTRTEQVKDDDKRLIAIGLKQEPPPFPKKRTSLAPFIQCDRAKRKAEKAASIARLQNMLLYNLPAEPSKPLMTFDEMFAETAALIDLLPPSAYKGKRLGEGEDE